MGNQDILVSGIGICHRLREENLEAWANRQYRQPTMYINVLPGIAMDSRQQVAYTAYLPTYHQNCPQQLIRIAYSQGFPRNPIICCRPIYQGLRCPAMDLCLSNIRKPFPCLQGVPPTMNHVWPNVASHPGNINCGAYSYDICCEIQYVDSVRHV